MEDVTRAKMVSYLLLNEPGALGKTAEMLSKNGINIIGLYCEEGAGKTLVNIITESPEKDKEILQSAGVEVVGIREILRVRAPSQRGTIARIAKKLGDTGVNIESYFITDCPEKHDSISFIEVSNVEKGIEALSR